MILMCLSHKNSPESKWARRSLKHHVRVGTWQPTRSRVKLIRPVIVSEIPIGAWAGDAGLVCVTPLFPSICTNLHEVQHLRYTPVCEKPGIPTVGKSAATWKELKSGVELVC